MKTHRENLVLRPVARMAQILGQHLIRDNTVGVLELVKNGYDADAENVIVELKNLGESTKTEIIIQDNGTGMDEDVIKGPWSEPAHGGKQNDKNTLKMSKKKRLPLGEKGVGRFATQKLGRMLEMVTRPEGGELEFIVTIDWDEFDKSDAYLDQIKFPFESRPPEIFTGNNHGTRLLMKNSPTPWKKSNVKALQASMMRLLSPSKENNDFTVTFRCTEYPEMENLDRGNILEKFQFKIDCKIDEKGIASYVYTHRELNGRITSNKESNVNIWASANTDWQKRNPTCGPLRIILYSWLRPVSNLKKYELTKEQLDALCGVSIYRDGFRIIPYGDKSDDWLRLDIRRTNQPGIKYGNNQIIGQIEITQKINKELIDKTSREGLWENEAYSDMRNIALGVISRLETESLEERNKVKQPTESTKTLKAKVEELQKQVHDIKTSQPDSVTKSEQKSTQEPIVKPQTISVPIEKIETIEKNAREIDSSFNKVIKEYSEITEEKREAFLHLIGIGLFTERFTHEFDRLVAGMSSNLEQLEKKHPHYSWVKIQRQNFEQLKNEIRLISAARYVRNPTQGKTVNVRTALDTSLDAYKSNIKRDHIKVEITGEGFDIKISLASISQILGNVISNALYWLNLKSEVTDRKMHITMDGQNKNIIISNNAGSIPRPIKNILFSNPFVTTKPDGRGLGLYISNEILKKNGGEINILTNDDSRNEYQSASFIIKFCSE